MISSNDLADLLHGITQSDILTFLNYTEILQLKAIIFHINQGKSHDQTS